MSKLTRLEEIIFKTAQAYHDAGLKDNTQVLPPRQAVSEVKAFVLAEMSQALNDSQYLPEFVTKLTERVKSW